MPGTDHQPSWRRCPDAEGRGRNRRKETTMCPACIATVALIAAGATSTGALSALIVNKLRAKTGAKNINPTTQTSGGQDGSSKNRERKRGSDLAIMHLDFTTCQVQVVGTTKCRNGSQDLIYFPACR